MQLLSLPNIIKKLQATIMKLQSDEVLLQMRNDASLYSCKMNYIKEMIEDEMNACGELAQSAAFAEGLQEKLKEREFCIEKMKGQYAVELENIEHNCRELIAQYDKKLKDKDENIARLRAEAETLQSKAQKGENGLSAGKEEILKLKQENGSLKHDRSHLEELRSQLQGEITKLKRQSQSKEKHTQTSMRQSFDQQYSKLVNEYEQKLQQMQKDMATIKQCWEKACLQLKAKMEEELTLEIIECENKFKRDLQEYAENLKMGSSVVFSDSEEIINKKVEIIKRGYTEEMNKLAEEVKHFQEELSQLRGEMQEKEEIIGELSNSLKQRQKQIEMSNKENRSALADKQKDVEKMRTETQHLSKELLASKKRNQELEDEARQSKDQLKSLTKKCNIASAKASELQEEVDACNKKISSQNAKIDEHLNKLISLREEITTKEQSISTLTVQVDKLKKTGEQLQSNLSYQMQQSLQINIRLRRDKQQKQKILEKMSRLQIQVRKISKDSQMLREEVNCTIQMLKNKMQSLFSLFNDSFTQKIEAITRKHKQQMGELLDEMQEKEKEMVSNLSSQKQELKMDIKEYEQVIKEKEGDIYRLKSYVSQLEQTKKDLMMDLQSQKLFTIRLEEKIESNEQSYASNIGKVQKEISRSMSSFNAYWSEQIGRVQQELDGKDAKLKQYAEKIQQLSNQIQENKKEQSWIEDQAKKYKKKYENLKQERDQKIDSLLKKLEQQGKHRINLERELKEVRMSVMKGTYQSNNNNNFSFNDKEKQSNSKPFTTTTKQDQHRQRERQFSEIREMIAKTYKVVDGPAERDICRNFSKKALF